MLNKNIPLAKIAIILFTINLISLSASALAAAKSDDADYEFDQDMNEVKIHDPIENINRKIFKFNNVADKYVLKPAAKSYKAVLPKLMRESVHSFFDNLSDPITFLNSLLQGNVDNALRVFGRFLSNSTLGVGGLFRIDTSNLNKEDFGQTLGHYGVNAGPYLMLPILGPSDLRDGIGLAADGLSDPLNYTLNTNARLAKNAIYGIDQRESLLYITDEIEKNSLDPYATYRSLYLQKRADLIKNGQ